MKLYATVAPVADRIAIVVVDRGSRVYSSFRVGFKA